MLDGVRPRRQLGEEKHGTEKEVAQLKHLFSLSGRHYVPVAKYWLSRPEPANL
jgi:hypothetical protein